MRHAFIKYCLFANIYLFLVSGIYAQSINRLLSELNTAQSEHEKVEILLKLAFEYQYNFSFNKAIEYFNKAKGSTDIEKDVELKIKTIKNTAYCHEQLGQYNSALENYTELQDTYMRLGRDDDADQVSELILSIYISQKNFEAAITECKKLGNNYIRKNNYSALATTYNNMAYIYKKLKNDSVAVIYIRKCHEIVKDYKNQIDTAHRIKMLINLGVIYTESGELEKAIVYLNDAYKLSVQSNDPLEQANTLNFIATYDFKLKKFKDSEKKVKAALELLSKSPESLRTKNITLSSYKILIELLYAQEKYADFKNFNDQYNRLKDDIISIEKEHNRLLLEQQLQVEKKESQIKAFIAEKEKQEMQLANSRLETEKKEKELQIKQQELTLLRQQQDIQSIQLRNQRLEKEKILNLLQLEQQKAKANEDLKQIEFLQKEKQIEQLKLRDKMKDYRLLSLQKQANDEKLADTQRYTAVINVIIALMAVILGLVAFGYWINAKKNKQLKAQQETITQQHAEILNQYMKLTEANAEMSALNEELTQQNQAMEEIQNLISRQNQELKNLNETLELKVAERTLDLQQTNEQLILHSNQVEQFAFIVSHNIRAPIARLLGLTSLITYHKIDDPKLNELIQKTVETSRELDRMVKDLNVILEIRKGLNEIYEWVDLQKIIHSVQGSLEKQIKDTDAKFEINFNNCNMIYSVKPYIESIFFNLISNAIKYKTPDKAPLIQISATDNGEQMVFVVKDNGLGIDIKRAGKQLFGLYQRFHTHIEGKGMGLFLVKSQVEALKGHIDIKSNINKGTQFSITLKKVNDAVVSNSHQTDKPITVTMPI